MPNDMDHALEHPEVAGWGLAAQTPATPGPSRTTGSCDQCQAAVAEFEPVAQVFRLAAPAAEPPADLEARSVAAVQHAVLAADRQERRPPGKASRCGICTGRSPHCRCLPPVAAAAVTAAVFIGVQVFQGAAPRRWRPRSTSTPRPATRDRAWPSPAVQMAASRSSSPSRACPVLGSGQFYECWYAGPDNRPGHPDLITAGTFVVDRTGSETFTMWSAADPRQVQYHADHRSTARRRQPAWQGNSLRHRPGLARRGPVISRATARSPS